MNLEREERAMLLAILMNCQFNRAFDGAVTLGARIFADGSYEIYDLAERAKKLETASVLRISPLTAPVAKMQRRRARTSPARQARLVPPAI